jgi:hypothetical protein
MLSKRGRIQINQCLRFMGLSICWGCLVSPESRADRRGLAAARRRLDCDVRGELMDSQLWPFYRLYQYRPRVSQHLERVHQWYHEVSPPLSLAFRSLHFPPRSESASSCLICSSNRNCLRYLWQRLTDRYMIKEKSKVFVKEYETTTTQYQNLSRT